MTLKVLPVVKAYPVIDPVSQTEAVCVAGISMGAPHQWIRLFPLDYRGLVYAKRFKKYEVIELDASKSTKDSRPESFTPVLDSITLGLSTPTTADGAGGSRSSTPWRTSRWPRQGGPNSCAGVAGDRGGCHAAGTSRRSTRQGARPFFAHAHNGTATTRARAIRYDSVSMARTWLAIRVELLSGVYAECDPAPGRVFLVGPRHTFQQLARAINVGFARWDHSHLYDFELADGNVVGFPDEDFGEDDVLDHATTNVLDRVGPGDRFGYRFDFGDEWVHECMVEPEKVDPIDVYGEPPVEPVPIFGWGTIPDQYGRITDGRDDESFTEPEMPFPFLHDELVRIIEINGGEPMTSADLADTINAEGRYQKKDGSAMTSSQVSARASKYPQLFERTDDGRIGLRRERRG